MSPKFKVEEVIDFYAKEEEFHPKEDYKSKSKKGNKAPVEKVIVLAASFDEYDKLLGCACGNKTLQFFSHHGNNFKREKIIPTVDVQYGVWYMSRHKAWITASRNPEIKIKKNSKRTTFYSIYRDFLIKI